MIYNDILYRKEPFLVSKKTPIPLARGRVTAACTMLMRSVREHDAVGTQARASLRHLMVCLEARRTHALSKALSALNMSWTEQGRRAI